MTIKYHVQLSGDERSMLERLIKQEKPKVAQHKKRRANILLAINALLIQGVHLFALMKVASSKLKKSLIQCLLSLASRSVMT